MRKMKLVALFTAALVAISSLPVYAANFADINNVPWEGAKTYINSVADKGIMVGDYNNAGQKVFRPRDGVTYCETMQLAYSLMKNSSGEGVSSSTVSKYTTVMNGYKIPSWAHEAVAYGLENKIVTISEIPAFVNSKGTSVNATRQDVAIIFGRTLDLIETLPTNPTLTYGDKASITAVAVPYVALLKQLNIMAGDTDGNFTPKASINRAEMAVVVSKTYDHLSGKDTTTTQTTGSLSGKVTNAVTVGNNTTIVVGGKQFMGDISTGVLDVNSTRIALSQVEVGDTVVVSYSGNKIMSVMVTASATGSSVEDWDVKGDFVSMGTYTIKIKVDGDTETYEFKDIDDVSFKYENKVMDADKFEEKVVAGDTIYITLDSKEYVETVEAEAGAEIDFDIEGYFSAIAEDKIKLKLSKSSTAKTYEFEDEDYDNVEFYKSTTTSKVSYSTFKKYVEANDEIGLIYNDDDEVEKVYIIKRASEGDYDVEGEFYSINERSIRIKDEDGKKVYYYFVGNEDDEDEEEDIYEDVEFYDDDGDEVDYDDFKELVDDHDGNVGIVLDKNDEVIEIYLIEGDDDSDYDAEGYLYSLSETRIKITEKENGSSSSAKTYYFDGYEDDEEDIYENVKYYDDDEDEVDDFDDFDEMVEKGDKIGLILNSDDEVTKIYLLEGGSSKTEEKSAALSRVDSDGIKLSGASRTYDVTSDTDVDIKDGSKKVDTYDELLEAYDDEKKDFYVTITFDEDYVVSKIEGYVTKVADARISDIDTSDDEIKVKCDSTTYTYEIDGSCDFDCNDDDYDNDFDGLDDLFKDAEDDDKYVYVDIKLNDEGKVTDIEVVDVD